MRKKLHLLFSIFLILLACGNKSAVGFVGKAYTLQAKVPEDSEDMDFIWDVTEKPDDSSLNYNDLDISDDYSTMTFIPDAAGNYRLEVKIFQYNDEIASQSFAFNIEDNGYMAEEDLLPVVPEETKTAAPEPVSEIVSRAEIDPSEPEPVKDEIVEQELEIPVIETVIKTKPKPKKKKLVKPYPGSKIPFDAGRFTIQVASKKNLDDAKIVAAGLIQDGYDAYIQKAYFEETDQVWFRVRVGSYDERETAKKVALKISEVMPEQAWVDFVRYEH